MQLGCHEDDDSVKDILLYTIKLDHVFEIDNPLSIILSPKSQYHSWPKCLIHLSHKDFNVQPASNNFFVDFFGLVRKANISCYSSARADPGFARLARWSWLHHQPHLCHLSQVAFISSWSISQLLWFDQFDEINLNLFFFSPEPPAYIFWYHNDEVGLQQWRWYLLNLKSICVLPQLGRVVWVSTWWDHCCHREWTGDTEPSYHQVKTQNWKPKPSGLWKASIYWLLQAK